jgi:hypothetical protein
MEFLIENTEPVPAPSDAELGEFLSSRADRYASPARTTFTHVFVSARHPGGDAAGAALALKTQLDAGADPATLGDPFLRGREFRLHAQGELANIFGAAFAAAVMALPENTWSGPVRSSYGEHLVRVTEKRAGTGPELAAVRERVERDWREARREVVNREAHTRLRAHYEVRVEGAGS